MFAEPEPNPATGFRKLLRYTWILIVLVALYSGWVVFSRWQENRDTQYKAKQERAAKEKAEAERTFETLGGNRFEILSFYAAPGLLRRGDTAELCYGVSNAKSVRIEPPVGEIWPSLSHCVNISPKKDTTYVLTAEDASGSSKTATLTLRVH